MKTIIYTVLAIAFFLISIYCFFSGLRIPAMTTEEENKEKFYKCLLAGLSVVAATMFLIFAGIAH